MVVLISAVRVKVTEVSVVGHWNDVGSVETVFCLHAGVGVHIYEVTDLSSLLEVELYASIHVECLVALSLAVGDAFQFLVV